MKKKVKNVCRRKLYNLFRGGKQGDNRDFGHSLNRPKEQKEDPPATGQPFFSWSSMQASTSSRHLQSSSLFSLQVRRLNEMSTLGLSRQGHPLHLQEPTRYTDKIFQVFCYLQGRDQVQSQLRLKIPLIFLPTLD